MTNSFPQNIERSVLSAPATTSPHGTRPAALLAATVLPALLLCLSLGARAAEPHSGEDGALAIVLKHGSSAEGQARQQLLRIAHVYDLGPWIFTKRIVIDENAIPHSHPELTLHVRHLRDDDLLLSTFVHEELHWYLAAHQMQTDAAISELKAAFPNLPVGAPYGSEDQAGNYLHLIVNYLEWRTDAELVGELRARVIMEFWAHDHYTTLYRTVLDHSRQIGQIIRQHQLLPESNPHGAPSATAPPGRKAAL
jgi:hypothetical protein